VRELREPVSCVRVAWLGNDRGESRLRGRRSSGSRIRFCLLSLPDLAGRPVVPSSAGTRHSSRIPTGQKTVRYSDLSEQLITDGSALVRVVLHEHPELDGHLVEIEAHLDEVKALTEVTLQVAVIDLHVTGEDEPRRVTLDAAVFDRPATARPMSELIIAALPTRRAPRPRAAAAAGGGRAGYGTLEHAGKPYKGKTTDAEEQLVREHLAEINQRLAAEGLRRSTSAIRRMSSVTGSRTWQPTPSPNGRAVRNARGSAV
jgi:hypothetical protein